MEIKEKKTTGLKKEFEITITNKSIEQLVQNKISELAPKASLPGFRVGKVPHNILKMRFFEKRSNLIGRGQKFLDRFGDYAVIFGRFVPAIRPIAPFLIGLSDLRAIRFYRADIIACLLWGIALIFLVLSVGSIFK